jgi:hypothetical protein
MGFCAAHHEGAAWTATINASDPSFFVGLRSMKCLAGKKQAH